MTNRKVPYSFIAKMENGQSLCQGDKPFMIDENATSREIEQLILEHLQDKGDVLSVLWAKMSDWNM